MAQIETWLSQDMLEAVKVQYLDGNIFSQDNAGNLIGVLLNRGGVPYAGGGSVSANVIRADGATIAVVGALSGNAATVVLPQSAYAVPGVVSIVMKLTVSGEVTTIAAVVANVYQSSTDSAIDPGTIIPSVQNLISAIQAAVASIPADYSSLWTSLAPAFSTSTNYTAGQYVTYNGALYRFTVDHPAGAWNSAHVTATNIGSDLNSLKSALSGVGASLGIDDFIIDAYNTKAAQSSFAIPFNGKAGDVICIYYGGTAKKSGTVFLYYQYEGSESLTNVGIIPVHEVVEKTLQQNITKISVYGTGLTIGGSMILSAYTNSGYTGMAKTLADTVEEIDSIHDELNNKVDIEYVNKNNNWLGYDFNNKTVEVSSSGISSSESETLFSANANDRINVKIATGSFNSCNLYFKYHGGSMTLIGNILTNVEYEYVLSQDIDSIGIYSQSSTPGDITLFVWKEKTDGILPVLDNKTESIHDALGFVSNKRTIKVGTSGIVDSMSLLPLVGNTGDTINISIKTTSFNSCYVYFEKNDGTRANIGSKRTNTNIEETLTYDIKGIAIYSSSSTAGEVEIEANIIKTQSMMLTANRAVEETNKKSGYDRFVYKEFTTKGTSVSSSDTKTPISAYRGETIEVSAYGDAFKNHTDIIYFYVNYSDSESMTNLQTIKRNGYTRIQLTDDIKAIGIYTTGLEANSVFYLVCRVVNEFGMPAYYNYNDYMKNKADRINSLAASCAGHGDAFIFITDQHWSINRKNSISLITYLNNNCYLPRLFSGGDVDNGVILSSVEYYQKTRKAFPHKIYSVMGNHDVINSTLGPDSLNAWAYYSDSYNDEMIGDAEKHYFYFDNKRLKIRYVILNAFYGNDGQTGTPGYDSAQQTWLEEEALNVPTGYGIICFTHYLNVWEPLSRDYQVCRLLDEAKSAGTDIIAVFTGHAHYDAVWHTPGGIPIIVTTCDKNTPWVVEEVDREPWITEYRTTGTINEQAFDVPIIDRTNRKIICVRIGCPAMNNVDLRQSDSGWSGAPMLEEREIDY